MKKSILFLFLLSLFSCQLDSKQEEKLNNSFQSYINAYNKDLTLELVAFTHVSVVKHYKSISNQDFIDHFHQKDSTHIFYGDYFVKETKQKNSDLQRCYTIEQYTADELLKSNYRIFAISSDNGNNWFFVNEDDYFNKEIPIPTRLFKK